MNTHMTHSGAHRRHHRSEPVRWNVILKCVAGRTLLMATAAIVLYALLCSLIDAHFAELKKEAAVETEVSQFQFSRLSAYMDNADFDALLMQTRERDYSDYYEEDETASVVSSRLGVEISNYDNSIDYSAKIKGVYELLEHTDDTDAIFALCEVYELQRNLKIADQEMDMDPSYTFNASNDADAIDAIMHPHVAWTSYTEQDLIDLARIVYAEAGASWCTDRHQQAVATVVVNRWKSPKWDDPTIHDVIHHDGQYPNTKNNKVYDERSLNNARYILEYGPLYWAQWQSNEPLGEIVEVFDYRANGHSVTYIGK